MKQLYETKISTARWMAYDIPGNIGWITYLVCTILCLRRGLSALSIAAIFPAALTLLGIVELISERIAKLDRILPKARLYRGFGVLTLGGLLGAVVAIVGLATQGGQPLFVWMLVGATLCGAFAGLLFKGYKHQ